MNRLAKILFFALVVRPLVLIGLGLNVVHRKHIPAVGPAVIAATHNSHLDTFVLMSLYPLWSIHKVRPIAAAGYFLANRWRAWFSQNIVDVILLDRTGGTDLEALFEPCRQALERGEILILFPEGSRGAPEQIGRLRKGLCHMLKGYEQVPVTPVVLHGLGRSLPRGEALFVPFNCDVVIGEPMFVSGKASAFLNQLSQVYDELFAQCLTRAADSTATLSSHSFSHLRESDDAGQ